MRTSALPAGALGAVRGGLAGAGVGLLCFGGVAAAGIVATDELRVPVVVGRVVDVEAVATVEGDLHPGARNPLRLTVTNREPVPVHVTGLGVDRFTGDPALVEHLVAADVLAPDGLDPATGRPRALVVPARGTVTVTVPDAVGLADGAGDAHAAARGGSLQGRGATVVLRATYAAVPGDETALLER